MTQIKYQVKIIWSNEDNCYVVELPEFSTEIQRYFTHGKTYEEALKNAREVLALLIESYQAEGRILPEPQTLQVA
ncbi:type II toxin-antitoxin system HicB family antitoxin [Oscillatoria sp. FACHB-1406]|uniref:type II toxin-antitoxin system HicB family antitoxin n=1 Tax=Oscillatoria sp. FACHB-1406 TaxID=2692846 RepID=UPI001685D42C|nr:type II toxin-antitoxin system HicB family antitoxin [Oscillatoria sp. FACHB-1406]MBD2576685.1 type II toxin-antitoxin system HicB family antitoxin [Oscillatoria sp. FACHB-1406]